MGLTTILFIAVALAMDAFAVSVASGIAIRNLRIRHALVVACWFGLFQAFMPLIGWLGGAKMAGFLGGIEHWVAFGLLAFVGVKMIYESFEIEAAEKRTNPLDVYVLFVLSLATSIDALAAGISFAMLKVAIATPLLVIGAVTFAMCFTGVWIGDKFGHFFERRIELVAGVVLIVIGARILLLHVGPWAG